ncbi:MAG: ABC transporter ATP-binding protein [bacterium]|nr:ABC transporter ATP-binding protein [bacterium]
MDDVSFSVGRGEVAALLGPNGSGKSTLMRCLIGYFSPTSGRVRVGGVEVGAGPVSERRRVGYLPEQVMLYPDLTVRRYLAFVAEVKGLDARARRRAVGEALERCGLVAMADRLTGKLSKGYRQRVGLAQALLGDPDVLVLDEPTVGLDPVQAVEMRGLVRALADRTVLLSTHILSEASALCSKIVILSKGRLVAEDSADGLARRLEGVGRVHVRVEGPADAVRALLAALPGVSAVSVDAGEGAGTRFVLSAPEPEGVQRAVAPAVVAAGYTLLEVQVATPTLEDLFVRAVR